MGPQVVPQTLGLPGGDSAVGRGTSEYLDARRSRALEPGDNRDRSNTRVRRAGGFDSAPIKLTMPFVALGAAKSLVDDFFWSRWRFEISVFDLVNIGRG